MHKKRDVLVMLIGIILVLYSAQYIYPITQKLFDNGSSDMEYRVNKELELDHFKNIIHSSTDIEKRNIEVKLENKNSLRIHFDYVDIEVLEDLDTNFRKEYPDKIELQSISTTGVARYNKSFIAILILNYILMLSGALLIWTGANHLIIKLKIVDLN